MTMRDIVGRISNQPAVGYKADENGAVLPPKTAWQVLQEHAGSIDIPNPGRDERCALVDLSPNQTGHLTRQFELISDRLAELDTLKRLVEQNVHTQALMSGRLDDMAKVADANERALGDRIRDLATENAELRQSVEIQAGEIAVLKAWQDEMREEVGPDTDLLEMGEED